jgi:hypothetical protein
MSKKERAKRLLQNKLCINCNFKNTCEKKSRKYLTCAKWEKESTHIGSLLNVVKQMYPSVINENFFKNGSMENIFNNSFYSNFAKMLGIPKDYLFGNEEKNKKPTK